MKKALLMVAAAVMVACGSAPTATIENLKDAATGEANASAKYAAFAEQAAKDSLFKVAAMFRATSKAESIHSANHLKVLKDYGVEYIPVIDAITVGTTLENLKAAKAGEEHEFTKMYPDYIKIALEEKATPAVTSMEFAMEAEKKHADYYATAIYSIEEGAGDAKVSETWYVCPVCGDTYSKEHLGKACALCGTVAEKFFEMGL